MSPHWRAVLGVILVYGFGCVSGWLGASLAHYHQTQLLQRDPEAVADLLERRLTGNLGLDSGQRDQVHQFLMQNLEQRKQLQGQIQPSIQQLNRLTYKEISAILPPDQRARFHQNIVDFRRRFGRNPLNPNADHQAPAASSGAGPNAAPSPADAAQ